MDEADIIPRTRRWIQQIVIGLNLCPFAQRVFGDERIRYTVCMADRPREIEAVLEQELRTLAEADVEKIETTLLILPRAFPDFLDFNDFLDPAERILGRLELEGVIQIASFHPGYQFADSPADDVAHFTNRSPYPMLHLLREESVDTVAGDPEFLAGIPERNIHTLRNLGLDGLRRLQQDDP